MKIFIISFLFALTSFALAELPEETASILEKLKAWELERQIELQEEIREKRSEVVEVLEKQLAATTKAGNLQGALAIKEELKRLVPLAAGEEKPMLGEKEEKVRIPREAYRGSKSHYLWIDKQVSWAEAQAECEKIGGNLVCIENEEEWDEVLNYRDENGFRGRRFWIGLSAAAEATDYEWVDGSQLGFENWGAQPTSKPEATGVVAGMNGTWIVYPKEENPGNHYFICEWSKE